ncbi:hypothetical protein [Okeania sp. SIO2B9]|uniref:hypothetical protein n=1 Tax=Okeania sp. SIO2B9 TaxID=2607782 RepID=UPI00142A86E2|nr:hypothetical protein [Okeania sp. SIO2B9]NES92062.1 hypothetical protein [Okeania sp. SIO2B9]
MLFTSALEQIQSNLQSYNQEIEELQFKLETLREQKKQLENHAQQLGSAENAAESALEQVKTALMMVRAIAPDQVGVFKQSIDELFAGNEELAIAPEKVEEIVEDEKTVTVKEDKNPGVALTVEVVEEALEGEEQAEVPVTEEQQEVVQLDIQADSPDFLEPKDFDKYTIKQLKALASYLNVKIWGKKSEMVSQLASQGLVREELDRIIKELK